MSHKLKLAALAVAALALPTLAAAQDPSTRTDLTIIGAVSNDKIEQVVDANATAAPDMPIVYDDEAANTEASETATAEESATAPSADLGHAVESE